MRSTRVRPRARACQTGVTRWEARGAPAQARRVHWAVLPPCYTFEILKAQHRCMQVYISHPGGWQLRGATPHLEGQLALSQCPHAPTCSTRLIHWKLSSSEASGRCSATSTTRSSCSTVTENTAILGEEETEMMASKGGRDADAPSCPDGSHSRAGGRRCPTEFKGKQPRTSSNVDEISFDSQNREHFSAQRTTRHTL